MSRTFLQYLINRSLTELQNLINRSLTAFDYVTLFL